MTHRVIQLYRGTSAQNDAFTGAAGELTMDTTNNELRIHDGSTAGGHKIGGGIKNQNTAAGATNPLYDWVGTLAEYTAQAVATNHPDWVCYITDDCEATAYQAYTQSQCNNLFVQKGHEVIAFQEPTAANNYTWYRKYADGWVEQGGPKASGTGQVNFPIVMANTGYQVQVTGGDDNYSINYIARNRTTTAVWVTARTTGGGDYNNWYGYWLVYGMAA